MPEVLKFLIKGLKQNLNIKLNNKLYLIIYNGYGKYCKNWKNILFFSVKQNKLYKYR